MRTINHILTPAYSTKTNRGKHKMFMKCICLFAAIMFLCRPRSVAQDVNYAIHANIIYHFTKYIDWPPSRKSGDFIIGIVGTTPLTDELKTSLANKKVGVQNIIVKKYPASTASFDCHILFISEDETRSFKKILAATKGLSILVVSEAEDLALRGSCINFTIANERLKLEINKVNIEQRELSIASELLKLGTIVKN